MTHSERFADEYVAVWNEPDAERRRSAAAAAAY
jgi:hypothetical protein